MTSTGDDSKPKEPYTGINPVMRIPNATFDGPTSSSTANDNLSIESRTENLIDKLFQNEPQNSNYKNDWQSELDSAFFNNKDKQNKQSNNMKYNDYTNCDQSIFIEPHHNQILDKNQKQTKPFVENQLAIQTFSNELDSDLHRWSSDFNITSNKPIKLKTCSMSKDSSKNNHLKSIQHETASTIKKRLASQEYNDYISDNDYSMIAMSTKPSTSSSLSKSFISRFNQLSLPVTRKLKFWNKKSFQVNQYDPNFKVIYLGNLGIQLWSKDEHCLEKPLATLWNNYLVNMKTEILMRLTICNSGLKAITRQHGLTQYWSNRLVYCCSHKNHPRVFTWIYRHEGKKMRKELRCHAVLCPSPEKAKKMVTLLSERMSCALQEFRREKKLCTRIEFATNSPTLQQEISASTPLRRQILAKGSANFRPPLDRSKSAPKLTPIVEEDSYEYDEYNDEDQSSQDEFEYQESFEDRDDDDDDSSASDACDERPSYTDDLDPELSTQNPDTESLTTMTNEETSGSSFVVSPDDCDAETNNCGDRQEFFTEHDGVNKNSKQDHSSTNQHNNIAGSKFNCIEDVVVNKTSANIETSISSAGLIAKRNAAIVTNRIDNNNSDLKKPVDDSLEACDTQEIVLSWPKFVIR